MIIDLSSTSVAINIGFILHQLMHHLILSIHNLSIKNQEIKYGSLRQKKNLPKIMYLGTNRVVGEHCCTPDGWRAT
jgi:hypothetical protein